MIMPASVLAAPPLLHNDDMLLNGKWNFYPKTGGSYTINVPDYWDAQPNFTTDRASYQRTVDVPLSWTGKVIKVEFEGINYIAAVYVNNIFIGEHTGGCVPFSFDITDKVVPGSSFQLKVDVKGGSYQPIVDSAGYPQWPIGWYGHQQRWGFFSDVWLRSYGKAHIEDAYIKTSYQEKKIEVVYTLKNSDSISRTLTIEADAVRNNVIEKSIVGQNVTLAPGESKEITLSSAWFNPALWMPDNPNLYILNSRLKEGGVVADQEKRRFGFREMWVSGNKYILNGTRVNLLGDSINFHSQSYKWKRYRHIHPDTWSGTINKLLDLNIRMVRFHQEPVQDFALDEADERGLMIIDESAIYARDKYINSRTPKATYLENSKSWIKEWIKGRRNHPSIILWSAENEMGVGWLKWLTNEQIKSLGDEIKKYDTTRSVIYDGDQDVGDTTVNYHYIGGDNQRFPSGSLYQWSNKVNPEKPTGVGEFLYFYPKDAINYEKSRWWHGLMSRGLRYSGFSDIRPYTLDWAWTTEQYAYGSTSPMALFLKNSFAPVALFDLEYDDLKADPIMNGIYPNIEEGKLITRNLALYNDEFRDTSVSVEINIKSNGITYASGTKTFSVPLGEHMDVPIAFQVPYAGGSNLEMELITKKNGAQKFKEIKIFKVKDMGLSGKSSNGVIFTTGNGSQIDTTPPAAPSGVRVE